MWGSHPTPDTWTCRLFKHATPQGSSSESATGEHCMHCLSCIQKALQWLLPMHQLYSERTWPLMHSIQVLTNCRPPKSPCTSFSTYSWGNPDMEGNDSRFANPVEVTVSWYSYVPSRVRQAAGGIALAWSYASDASAHAPQSSRGTRYEMLRLSYKSLDWHCPQCTSGKPPLCHFYNCFGIQSPNISGPHSSLIMGEVRIC